MRKLVLALLISVLIISCKQESSPEFKFKKDGVSFAGPAGWKISDEENIDDIGYYLSVEKDGFDSSGIVTISWVNDTLELQNYLEIYQDELKSNPIYKNSDLTFEAITANTFNSIASESSSFKMSVLGVQHKGIIHSFYGNNKTIVVLKQEAIEDTDENKLGFERIEESFTLE